MGLDPGLGFLHADANGRDSLACDLMEPVRPSVDAFVYIYALQLIKSMLMPRIHIFITENAPGDDYCKKTNGATDGTRACCVGSTSTAKSM